MLIVGEELDFCDSASVFLQVGDKFARSDLPHSYFALHAARAHKLTALSQADRGDATLVCIVDLPQELAVVHSVRPDFPIGPATEDDLIREDGTKWENAASTWSILGRACYASGCHGV